jgi:hypothetical protein
MGSPKYCLAVSMAENMMNSITENYVVKVKDMSYYNVGILPCNGA